jgi:hypothetical protein
VAFALEGCTGWRFVAETDGKLAVPIAATFPMEQIRDAVTLRRVHGKLIFALKCDPRDCQMWTGSHGVAERTSTSAGLSVQADYDPGWYPKGVKITDKQLAALPLDPHDFHGEWNYTINAQLISA